MIDGMEIYYVLIVCRLVSYIQMVDSEQIEEKFCIFPYEIQCAKVWHVLYLYSDKACRHIIRSAPDWVVIHPLHVCISNLLAGMFSSTFVLSCLQFHYDL